MRKKLWLAIAVLLIAGAIFYLENPGFLQSWFAGIIHSRKDGASMPEELEQRVSELLSGSRTSDKEAQVQPEADGPGSPSNVQYGKLGEKFFGPGEIKQIGLEIDLAQVPYRADLDLSRLRLGCPVVDCIPSIDAPRFETPAEAQWLRGEDWVVALTFQGISRAYAVHILNWHEVVNDDFNGTAVVVSYCPLCHSAVSFVAPVLQGQVAKFGVSGRLYNSDLVLYDRVTKSMWSQIERAVIAGPLAGNSPSLDTIPVDIVPWESWKAQHPDGQVLARPMTSDALGGKPPRDADPAKARLTRDFNNDPYRFYKVNNADTFGLPFEDKRLPAKAEVVGVEAGESDKAYPRELVIANKLINDEIGGVPVALVFDEKLGRILAFERPSPTALTLQGDQVSDGRGSWQLDGQAVLDTTEPLQPLWSTPAFWFAWAAFHPQTQLYAVKP